MISVYGGQDGQGKTYALAQEIKRRLAAGEDCWVYHALKIKSTSPHLHYWHGIDDWKRIKNGTIFVDEGQIWLNSRHWDTLPDWLQWKLQQHRHQGLDLILTVPGKGMNRLEITARELVRRYYVCTKFGWSRENSKRPWGLIRVIEYNADDWNKDETKKEILGIRWLIITKKNCEYYDTHADIGTEEHQGDLLVFKYTICEKCGQRVFVSKGWESSTPPPINPPQTPPQVTLGAPGAAPITPAPRAALARRIIKIFVGKKPFPPEPPSDASEP